MPQLEFSTYFSQFFWLMITFLLLFFFLSKIYLPKILGVFELRSRAISENIKAAHVAKDEAARLKKEYEELISKAAEERSKKLEEFNREVSKMVELSLHKQEEELKEQLSKAELRMRDFENNSSGDVADIARLAVNEIVSNLGLTNFNKEQIEVVMEKVKQEGRYVI